MAYTIKVKWYESDILYNDMTLLYERDTNLTINANGFPLAPYTSYPYVDFSPLDESTIAIDINISESETPIPQTRKYYVLEVISNNEVKTIYYELIYGYSSSNLASLYGYVDKDRAKADIFGTIGYVGGDYYNNLSINIYFGIYSNDESGVKIFTIGDLKTTKTDGTKVSTVETTFSYRPTSPNRLMTFNEPIEDIEEDNAIGPDSTVGGGDGTFDPGGQETPQPNLPSFNVGSLGFISIYKCTENSLVDISNWLWSTNFIDNIPKLWNNPSDVIVNLKVMPNLPISTTSMSFKAGTLTKADITVNRCNQTFISVNTDFVNVSEYFGTFMDYSPFTEISIYVPFVGMQKLNVDEVMNRNIQIRYHIEIYTGSFVAHVLTIDSAGNEKYLYSYPGSMSMELPITSIDYTNIYRSVINSVVGVGTGVAGAVAGTMVAPGAGTIAGAVAGGMIASGVSGAVGTMLEKPQYAHSGAVSGSIGFMGQWQPYIYVTRPIQSRAKHFDVLKGYVSNTGQSLSALRGFTKFSSIKVYGSNIDENEILEIEKLLKEGVIL